MSSSTFESKETARLEAFSDGVFAFAITLLVLDMKDPTLNGGTLLEGLVREWLLCHACATMPSTYVKPVTISLRPINHVRGDE